MIKKKNLEDFAHNYIKTRVKCPQCSLIFKSKNQVRVYDTLSGVSWHISRDHADISTERLDEIVQVLKKLSIALHWGTLPEETRKYL